MPIPALPQHVDKAVTKQKSSQPLTVEDSPDSLIQQARFAPNTLRAGDVIQLQRMIGNQAVSRLLNAPSHEIAPGQSFVQLKRTTKPDDQALLNKFVGGLPSKVLAGKNTLSEKGDAIWQHLNELYITNLGKGTGYWQDLNKAILDYQNAQTKAAVINTNTQKRSGYDALFNANYANTLESTDPNKYHVSTQGYDSARKPKPIVPTGGSQGNYSNDFDVEKGAITAKWNFGAEVDRNTGQVTKYDDKALKAKKGVNNSEILWQQYKLAAAEQYKNEAQPEGEVKKALLKIKKIKRDSVINAETKETVFMAYPDGEDWTTTPKEWKPSDEGFLAILGTPNAKSSVFFLKDHLDELEKTILKIKTYRVSDMKIEYTAIPKPLPPPTQKQIPRKPLPPPPKQLPPTPQTLLPQVSNTNNTTTTSSVNNED